MRNILWFSVPFILVFAALVASYDWIVDQPPASQALVPSPVPGASALVGQVIPAAHLIEAQSRAPMADQGLVLPDTAVVILLGGIGCSGNQVKLLQSWSEWHTESQEHPVVAIYADPLLGVGQGIRESLLLRRVSQATFPFLVSEDSTFNPRKMGIRTPQVALVESQVITQMFDVLAELRSPVVP